MSESLVAQVPVDATEPPDASPTPWHGAAASARNRRRHAADRRFRLMGLTAVIVSAGILLFLVGTMVVQGIGGFTRTTVALPIVPRSTGAGLIEETGAAAAAAFGQGGDRFVADTAWTRVRDAVARDPAVIGRRIVVAVPASADIDVAAKQEGTPAAEAAVARLTRAGVLHRAINWNLFAWSDSTDPATAGIWGALKGSLMTMAVTMALAFPIGLFAALYLEEFAARNRWTDLIEVSINNLAAVPSIIFGLLGLALFLDTLHLPRSAPVVGGLTLALMTMPVIVIAGRNAIRAVPPSVREAAQGVGASRVQVVFDHVLPLALPGILTGTIIGMARAIGETAPLLMIGMRAFIAAPPHTLTDPATVLPVQIFLWSDEVSRAFVEKTSAAILVLLTVLLAMNGAAIYLRNRFEQRR